MQVKEIMKTDVKTIGPKSTVQEAAKKMVQFGIGSLIISSGKKLLGIITDRDILVKIVAKGGDPAKTMVEDVMTKNVIMIDGAKNITDASELMVEKKIKKLPVIQEDNLIGIVTATDIVTTEPKFLEALGKLFLLNDKKKNVAG